MRKTLEDKLKSLMKEYAELQTILTISEKRQKELREEIINFAEKHNQFSFLDTENALKLDIKTIHQCRFSQTALKEADINLYNSFKRPITFQTVSVKKL